MLAAFVIAMSDARAEEFRCEGTAREGSNENVVVPQGADWDLTGTTVTRSVLVMPGSSLTVSGGSNENAGATVLPLGIGVGGPVSGLRWMLARTGMYSGLRAFTRSGAAA